MLSMTFGSYKGSKSKDPIGDNGSRWLLLFSLFSKSLSYDFFWSWELLYGESSLGDQETKDSQVHGLLVAYRRERG